MKGKKIAIKVFWKCDDGTEIECIPAREGLTKKTSIIKRIKRYFKRRQQ